MPNLTSSGEYVLDYKQGALLPSVTIEWYDAPAANGVLVPMGAGTYTFELKIARTENGAALVTKTTGITGANTAPNVTIDWAAGDLGALAAGEYVVTLKATRVSDSKPRFLPARVRLIIAPVPT